MPNDDDDDAHHRHSHRPGATDDETAADIHVEEDVEGASSWLASFFNLSNTAIGAGTLALPYIMHQCGLLLGLLLLCVVGSLSWFSLYCLTETARLTRQRTFIGIAKTCFGVEGERWTSVVLCTMLLGPLSAYINIIGSSASSITHDLHLDSLEGTSRLAVMTLSTAVVLLPLSLIPSLRVIAYASFLALFAIGYTIVLLPVLLLQAVTRSDWHWPAYHLLIHPAMSILSGFSTMGMAFVNHCTVVEILADLRPIHSDSDSETTRRHRLTAASSALIMLVYGVVSVAGYLLFGDRVTGNVLDGAGDSAAVMVARGVVAVGIALTYPLLVTPARDCLDRAVAKYFDAKSIRLRFFIETVAVVAVSYGIAVAIPNLDKIFALFGALTGSLIVYILPAAFYVRALLDNNLILLHHQHHHRHRGLHFWPWRISLAAGHQTGQTAPLLAASSQSIEPARPVWPLSLVLVYVNLFVGVLLLVIGTGYSVVDLFYDDDDNS